MLSGRQTQLEIYILCLIKTLQDHFTNVSLLPFRVHSIAAMGCRRSWALIRRPFRMASPHTKPQSREMAAAHRQQANPKSEKAAWGSNTISVNTAICRKDRCSAPQELLTQRGEERGAFLKKSVLHLIYHSFHSANFLQHTQVNSCKITRIFKIYSTLLFKIINHQGFGTLVSFHT